MLSRLAAAAAALALAACSSSTGPKPAELPDIANAKRIRVLWSADAGDGANYFFFPALTADAAFVAARDGSVTRLDPKNGNQVWRTDRNEKSNWTTPLVWRNDRRIEIVTAATGGVRSYDVNGTLLWELSGMSTFDVPSPISANGLLYIMSGYPANALRPVYAIRPGATGDISLKPDQTSNAFIVWADRTLGTFHPSPLVYRGCLYILHDRGFLTCSESATGKPIYGRQRISTDTATFTASPWAYNGKIFALSEDGDTYVIQAGPEFKVLGKNSLGEMTLATPAVSRGSLIIRTASKLYRVAKKPA